MTRKAKAASVSPEIRLAGPADLDDVVALAAALWPDEPPREHRKHQGATLAGKPVSTLPLVVLLATQQGRTVGFIEVGLRSHADGCDSAKAVGFIEGWFVEKPLRGRGVGRALMAAAEAWAWAQGCVEMGSDTWSNNRPSVLAHQALGFEVVDRCVNFRKPLAPPRKKRQLSSRPTKPAAKTGS